MQLGSSPASCLVSAINSKRRVRLLSSPTLLVTREEAGPLVMMDPEGEPCFWEYDLERLHCPPQPPVAAAASELQPNGAVRRKRCPGIARADAPATFEALIMPAALELGKTAMQEKQLLVLEELAQKKVAEQMQKVHSLLVSFCRRSFKRTKGGPFENANYVFLWPVDPLTYPQYYEAIQRPMDLSTVHYKRVQGDYKYSPDGFEAFASDLKLIVWNCKEFNHEESVYYEAGEAFEKEVNLQLRAAREEVNGAAGVARGRR